MSKPLFVIILSDNKSHAVKYPFALNISERIFTDSFNGWAFTVSGCLGFQGIF